MTKEQLFDTVKLLISKLDELKQTGNLRWKDMDEKLLLAKVYNEIYKGINLNLACDDCVKNYLHMLSAWYEREYPLYVASLPALQDNQITELTETSATPKTRRKRK